jgi:TRAP-type C4-dicarboxylate transport system substrate-binding protein
LKKKGLVLLVSICLILAVVACAAPAPAPAPKPTPTPAPAPKPQPVTMKFHMMFAEASMEYRDIFGPWAKKVETDTSGQVKFDFYFNSALGPPNGQWERLSTGVTDVEWIIPGYAAGLFPLTSVLELPFLGVDYSTETYCRIMNDLEQKFPEFRAEHKDAKMLVAATTSPQGVHTVTKPLRTMEDWKGAKIRSAGAVSSKTIELLGGSAVAMPVSDVFLALDKKTVDGVMMSMGAFRAMKLLDVLKYHTFMTAGTVPIWVAMNSKKWAALPKDIQDTVDKISSTWWQVVGKSFDNEVNAAIAEIKTRGQEMIYPSQDELAKWANACKPQTDEWLAMTKSKGLPGQAILDEVIALAKKYKK